jgi:hypothetical protein
MKIQVTNVTVFYGRSRQPAKYESADAKIEFSASISEGVNPDQDHIVAATKLLGEAKTIVLTELGLVEVGQSASAVVIAEQNASGTSAAKPATTRKKKDDAPATGQAISTGEARIDPAQAALGIPDGSAPVVAAVNDIDGGSKAPAKPAAPPQVATAAQATGAPTAEELTAYVSALVREKKLDSPTVKAISRSFGAEKIAQIDPAKLGQYKAEIDAKVKEFAAASDI